MTSVASNHYEVGIIVDVPAVLPLFLKRLTVVIRVIRVHVMGMVRVGGINTGLAAPLSRGRTFVGTPPMIFLLVA
jgi:hypothetical protein